MVLTNTYKDLHEKIALHKARIGIVGLGYVGLPLCLTYAEKGYSVLGLDIDDGKVNSIRSGESYIKHIDAERIQSACSKGLLDATTDFKKASDVRSYISSFFV